MNLKVARFINLLITSTMVGNEFGSWIALHPALSTLPTDIHVRAEQAVVRQYGRIMPVWMTATLVSCALVLTRIRDRRSAAFRFTLGGIACFLATLGVTLIGNVPINLRILRLSPDMPGSDWMALRKRWDGWHALRNVLNVLGLGLLYGSVLFDPRPQEKR